MPAFQDLPLELVIKILSVLDFRTVLNCQLVCKLFYEIIKQEAAIQYIIELAVSGMEDGPPSAIGPADRLNRLRMHRTAWHKMRWTSQEETRMQNGTVWELYGGVLAQSENDKSIAFIQLPSEIRGIEEKSWEVNDLGLKIRDFGMDPAQDLLVIIEAPESSETHYRVHLRTLSTGKDHPAAPRPASLTHRPRGNNYSFAIQTCTDYIGILFDSGAEEEDSELVIWNWKTGDVEMALSETILGSFVFLTERLILLACVKNEDGLPDFIVADFRASSNEMVPTQDMEYVCSLRFPTMKDQTAIRALSIRSDPAPAWRPHPDLKVPFHVVRDERLLVVTIWVQVEMNFMPLALFLPSTTVMRRVQSMEPEEKNRVFSWDEWGPSGTRLLPAPINHSHTWVCYVYGMSFVSMLRSSMHGHTRMIQIYDFNQLGYKKRSVHEDDEDDDNVIRTRYVQEEIPITVIQSVFTDEVKTSLPFRWQIFNPPLREDGTHARFEAVMLSEDSVVMVGGVSFPYYLHVQDSSDDAVAYTDNALVPIEHAEQAVPTINVLRGLKI